MIKLKRVLNPLLYLSLAVLLFSCAATPQHESSGEYMDDTVISSKVKMAIIGDKSLKVFQISVETYKGQVQLSGFVDSPQTVERAEEVAGAVKGVQSVKNSLIVK